MRRYRTEVSRSYPVTLHITKPMFTREFTALAFRCREQVGRLRSVRRSLWIQDTGNGLQPVQTP